jgi:hypothetical protein
MICLSETSGRALPDNLELRDLTLLLYSERVGDNSQTIDLKSSFREVEEDIRKMLDVDK